MEKSGKCLMRMITVVLLIVGMFVVQISASASPNDQSIGQLLDCIKPCLVECIKPDPDSQQLTNICVRKCLPPCLKAPLQNSHRKILAN
ncbi:hypothetical protein MKW94_023933 [Papaver nudicaule]|uniref:Plant thionin family protein n=1 Tax=Papaver nudicaule TaxID=74823 RepID=A0AA41SNW2_PAPNU|nr:hypothetical protein [Papaver nudicaule]